MGEVSDRAPFGGGRRPCRTWKRDLVEELLAPYEAAHPGGDHAAMIARHLLDPVIIPLLEEKLAQVGE